MSLNPSAPIYDGSDARSHEMGLAKLNAKQEFVNQVCVLADRVHVRTD